MPELEYKSFDLKELGEAGDLEGYASVFDSVDRGGDIIDKAAYDKEIKEWQSGKKLPKMLFNHDPSKVIGVWTGYQKDSKGLKLTGRLLLELPLGKDVYTMLRASAIEGLSIGYRTRDYEMVDKTSNRLLKDIELFETSVVTIPMEPKATVTSVKTETSIRDVERALRDAGIPIEFAKLVAAHGYKKASELVTQRDAGPDPAEAAMLLLQLNKRRF